MTQSFAISTSHPDALRLAQSVANLISWICRDAICSSRLRKDADIGAVYLPSPFLSPGPLQLVSVANFIIHKNKAENYFFSGFENRQSLGCPSISLCLPLDPCWIPLSAIELMPPNLNWEDCFFSIRIFQKIPSFFIVRTNQCTRNTVNLVAATLTMSSFLQSLKWTLTESWWSCQSMTN